MKPVKSGKQTKAQYRRQSKIIEEGFGEGREVAKNFFDLPRHKQGEIIKRAAQESNRLQALKSGKCMEWEYVWELKLNSLMGDKLYQGKETDFTVTHIKDLIRNILSQNRTDILKRLERLKKEVHCKNHHDSMPLDCKTCEFAVRAGFGYGLTEEIKSERRCGWNAAISKVKEII